MNGRRLKIFSDPVLENSFLFAAGALIFARSSKINGMWVVWFTCSHSQNSFLELKEAVSAVNRKFVRWIMENEIHKGTPKKSLR